MAVKSRAVSVATTATRLDSTTDIAPTSLAVYNNGASTVYVGGSDVTTSNGVPVAANTWGPSIDLSAATRASDPNYNTNAEAIYAIVASGTVEVRVIETGVA